MSTKEEPQCRRCAFGVLKYNEPHDKRDPLCSRNHAGRGGTTPTEEELAARADKKRFERADALERYKAAANMFRFEGERMLEAKTTHEMEVSLNYLMSYYTQAMAAFKEYQAAHLYLDARGIR